MTHHVAQLDGHSVALVIANHKPANARRTKSLEAAHVEARITKLSPQEHSGGRRGIRIKARKTKGLEAAQTVDIAGEDLYALREFLAELPEEAFTRPADPVEKPDRWSTGDIVEEVFPSTVLPGRVWVRDGDGKWGRRGTNLTIDDDSVQAGLGGCYSTDLTIIRQKSGQDL